MRCKSNELKGAAVAFEAMQVTYWPHKKSKVSRDVEINVYNSTRGVVGNHVPVWSFSEEMLQAIQNG